MLRFLAVLVGLATAAQFSPNRTREYGVLLVAPEGGQSLARALRDWQASLAKRFSLQAGSLSDTKSLQDALSRLEKERVRKIVVVPLLISSHEIAMDHLRYLLGIREQPAPDYLSGLYRQVGLARIERLKFSAPMVLSPALDDSSYAVEILASRAAALKPKTGPCGLLVVAQGAADDRKNSQWLGQLKGVAEAAGRKAGFERVETFVWPANLSPKQRRAETLRLRKEALYLRRRGPLAAIPYALEQEEISDQIAEALKGTFVKFNGKALLPDTRLANWISLRAREAARLPDMRLFKDAGRQHSKPTKILIHAGMEKQ